MAAGKRILVHAYSGGASIQGIAGGKIVADDALFTSASSGTFWSGRTVFQCLLTGGITRVPINKLQAGLYVALIKENGKTTYQQNIIKK